jgi:cellobiose phosphorylase
MLNERFWDGNWYQRAKTDAGEIIGGHQCEAGQIYLNTQSWAILSRTAAPERASSCLSSVNQRLMTDYGPLLLAPAYTKHRPDIGRITGDRPGFVENGSNYVHATMFYVHALYAAGLVEEAWDVMSRVLPQNPRNPTTNSELEPYILTNSFYGPGSEKPGKALFPWRTGTSCWFLKIVWEDLLGFVPTFEGLRIQPNLPKALRSAPVSAVRKTRAGDITVDLAGGTRPIYDLEIASGDIIPWNKLRSGMIIRVK